MTMQQVTMSEYLKTRYGSFPHCGSCVCQKCLYWWSGRCPEGECYDDKRAKEEPYNKAFPERSPRTQWSNWNLPGEQAHWCRGGTFYPVSYCEHFVKISGSRDRRLYTSTGAVFSRWIPKMHAERPDRMRSMCNGEKR